MHVLILVLPIVQPYKALHLPRVAAAVQRTVIPFLVTRISLASVRVRILTSKTPGEPTYTPYATCFHSPYINPLRHSCIYQVFL